MKALLTLLFALICYNGLLAQRTTQITVKAGSKIRDVLTAADIYYSPQFAVGKVLFRDGSKSVAKLNYSRLVDEMHFIDPGGDTLALTDEKTIKYISIDKDTFLYSKGYVKLIASNDAARLAVKQSWFVVDTRKIGAYNLANTASSITSYSTYVNGRSYDLNLNEDIVLRMAETYYFGDAYNHFVLAGKKNLLLLFPKLQRHIEAYLKDNKVDFSNKDDLAGVVQFLGRL